MRNLLRLLFASNILLLSAEGHTSADENAQPEKLVVAGGCFWCVESDFEAIDGVLSAESIYTGGTTDNPDYKTVSKGGTGHYEAVIIRFDSKQVTRKELLDFFWRTIDPLDPKGQFCDKGESYRSALFYASAEEKSLMEKSLRTAQNNLEKPFRKQKIATQILPLKKIFLAEDYHQDYYKKNPIRYKFYRSSCGRDSRLEKIWGDKAGQFKMSQPTEPVEGDSAK